MYHQILQTAKHMQGTQIFGVLQFLKTFILQTQTSDQYSTKSYLITVNETENFLCCYTC